jgi:hypothetical protein
MAQWRSRLDCWMVPLLLSLWVASTLCSPTLRTFTCELSDGSCPPQFFKGGVMETCMSCPIGAQCLGGSFLPVPGRGYWGDPRAVSKAVKTGTQVSPQIISCSRHTCKGGIDTDGQIVDKDCWDNSGQPSSCERELNNLLCTEGSRGPLCQVSHQILLLILVRFPFHLKFFGCLFRVASLASIIDQDPRPASRAKTRWFSPALKSDTWSRLYLYSWLVF